MIVAAASTTVGAMVIFGWIFDIGSLKTVVPGYMSMKMNTALSFVVSGVLVYNLLKLRSRGITIILSSLLIVLHSSSLVQNIFVVDLGIDELFITDYDARIQGFPFPGRIAVLTAFCFILFGISMQLIESQKKMAQYFLHIVSIVSFLAIVGYFYSVPSLYKLSFLTSMALHTAVMLFVLSVGVSLYNPDRGITGIFTGTGVGNRIARRIFPIITVAIFILGFFRTRAHTYHLVSVEFGIALFATSFIFVSLVIVWDTVRLLNSIDEKRSIAENELIRANKELLIQKEEKAIKDAELIIAKERLLQNEEKEKQTAELVRSEERLNAAQATARIGSWELDLQTFELTWSREHYRMFEMDETPAEKLYDAYRSKIYPEYIPELDRLVNLAIEKGLGFEYEHGILCKDGSIKHVLGIGQIVTNADGKVVGVHGTCQDITERKKAEVQIIQISERLDLAAKTANIGIWEFNISDGSLIWDEQMFALYGIGSDTFSETYNAWHHSLHPEDRDRAEQEFNSAIAGEKSFNTEFRVVWPDKSVHYLQAFAKVIFDSSGQAVNVIGTNYDVTDLKEKEKELELLNATKDKFFSIVAHDLKSPLTTLEAFSEMLIDEQDQLSKEEISDIAGKLKNSVANTVKMADNLIAWARTQMNDVEMKQETILVEDIVNNINAVYNEIAVAKGILFSCTVENSLIIFGDKNQIEFIIRNLVNNAIKFTSKGGFVNLEVKSLPEGEVEISVSDNGAGMSDKVQAGLFSVGKKTSFPGTEGEKGTGLGLMLSKEFIKLNGGQISVESKLGEGTIFRAYLKSHIHFYPR